MRAARAGVDAVKEHGLYWWRAGSAAEAAYLVALLNAPSLRQAFKDARSSDRHFDLTPWKRVPIPKYDSKLPDHKALAKLTKNAEAAVRKWLKEQDVSREVRPIKDPNTIHKLLSAKGILANIDALAKKLLPDQAKP